MNCGTCFFASSVVLCTEDLVSPRVMLMFSLTSLFFSAVNEYQEQSIQATRDIADNFLESQKEVINSVQSLWVPYMENVQNMYGSYWMSPNRLTENYTRAVSNITDSTIAATRLANNFMFASMEAWKTTVQHTRDNANEFSRLNANYAKTLQNLAKDNLRDYQTR